MSLSRESISAIADYVKETVGVPEWGGDVVMREMSSRHLDAVLAFADRAEKGLNDEKPEGTQQSLFRLIQTQVELISYCLADEEGTLLFDDEEGRAILAERSREVINRLFDAGMRINKLTDDEVDKEKKDLQLIPSNGSDSLSVLHSAAP